MSDPWLQNLVVRGPAADVTAFRRAAAGPEKKRGYAAKPRHKTQRLSFARLRGLLPSKQAQRFDPKPEEPWDLACDPREKLKDGSVELTYRFQLARFEPDALIIAVSRLYPRLCFVLGCVAPNVDEQSSRLVHNGRSRMWRLSERHKKALGAKVPEETEENADEVTWALAETDWAMMDEVVAHWRPQMDRLMARVLGKRLAAGRRSGRDK